MSSLRLATGVLLLVGAALPMAACDTDDGRVLREPAPGATAPPMPTSTSTTVAVANPPVGSDDVGPFTLASAAFIDGAAMPERQASCEGDANLSPALTWTGVPAGTAELALAMVDPDAPAGPYVHWVVVGIDPSVTGVGDGGVPETAVEVQRWVGPCPPEGETHDYVFTLYALAAPAGAEPAADAASAIAALEDAAITRAQLTGTYGRPSS